MSHFRTFIVRSTLISIGASLFMFGCEPEPLLDNTTADSSYSGESDSAWDEDSWWNQDVSRENDAIIDDKDTKAPDDTELADTSDVNIPDEQDTKNPAKEPHPDFVAAAEILRNSCGIAGCHGAAAQGNFAMVGGMDATDSQVRIALEGIKAVNGEMLIEPDDASKSDIYLRLITDEVGIRMPLSPYQPLDQIKIDAIKNWIDSGAPYE